MALSALLLLAGACGATDNPRGWAGPELADDTLYVSTDPGKMSALDPGDFTQKWVFPPKEEKDLKLKGIYGAPVVEGDTVYFGAYDGKVYAVRAAEGTQAWVAPFETGGPVVGRLALTEDKSTLFATSDDGKLYGLDPASGELKVGPFDAGDSILAGALVDGAYVYVASVNGKLFKLDAKTLEPAWDRPFEADAGLLTDPVLTGEGTILVGGIDYKLHAVDAETGQKVWSSRADNWFWGRPLVDRGTVYAPSLDKHVYALDLATGRKKWAFSTDAPVRSGPILAGDALVIVDKGGTAYFLDPANGSTKRSPVEIETTVLSDPLPLDEKVLIVAQGGDMHTVNPADGALAKVTVQVPQ